MRQSDYHRYRHRHRQAVKHSREPYRVPPSRRETTSAGQSQREPARASIWPSPPKCTANKGAIMSLMFCDSYDHYAVTSDKWTNGDGASNNDLTGTLSRTGIGCGVLNGVLAPSYGIAAGLGPFYTGCAMNFNALNGGGRPCSPFGAEETCCAPSICSNGSIVIESVQSGYQSRKIRARSCGRGGLRLFRAFLRPHPGWRQ